MIIADENLSQEQINKLVDFGYEVFSIRENCQGFSDIEVIDVVKAKGGILITEDKDFGELVFSYGIRNCTIIFLRYEKKDQDQIHLNILKGLDFYAKNNGLYFITITKEKIRIRKI